MSFHKVVAPLQRRVASRPRGQVFVLVTLAIVALLGISTLAVDVGNLWTTRRHMQNAADAAAMAAVDEIAIGATGSVTSAARAAAAQNGFTNGSSTVGSSSLVSVTVNNPPTSGPYLNNTNAVQVIVSQSQPTYFMRVLGWKTVAVSALATAATVNGGSCVYALDPSDPGAITIGGTGYLNSVCGVYDNSNDPSSALTVSGGGVLQAPVVGVVGGTNINGGGSTPPTTGIAAFGDPLAWVPAPTVGSCSNYSMQNIGTTVTLNPGLYCGGLKLNASAVVTFNPGTYIMDGGGLTILGGATATGTGVTFYLTGQNTSNSSPNSYGGVNIAGGANVNLSAPCDNSAGVEGMLFFQDRADTNGVGSTINGGSGSTFSGSIYFPSTSLSYSGNSGANQYTLIVADTLTINGTTNVMNNYTCLANGSLIKTAALGQ